LATKIASNEQLSTLNPRDDEKVRKKSKFPLNDIQNYWYGWFALIYGFVDCVNTAGKSTLDLPQPIFVDFQTRH
jgi:hypothetical protein